MLNVGCGTGAITAGIARRVSPTGRSVGVDVNALLIKEAKERHVDVPCLEFAERDVYDLGHDGAFDIATSAVPARGRGYEMNPCVRDDGKRSRWHEGYEMTRAVC